MRSPQEQARYVANSLERWKRQRKPKRSKSLRAKVFARDKGICARCGKFHPGWWHDHIHPLADGGADTLENSQTLCPDCEKPKTAREATNRAHHARAAAADEQHQIRMAGKFKPYVLKGVHQITGREKTYGAYADEKHRDQALRKLRRRHRDVDFKLETRGTT